MNGRNSRKKMINKIRTTIYRKQKKVATQIAIDKIKNEIKQISVWNKLKLLFGKIELGK